MTKDWKEALAEDCEDYLLHRYIPLMSHSYDAKGWGFMRGGVKKYEEKW